MFNMSTVTKATTTLLKDALAKKYTIARGEYMNDDPSITPWVGIYRAKLALEPLTLGRTSNRFLTDVSLLIIVQASSGKDGAQAEERLEEYQSAVISALDADPTLGGTVQTITGYSVEYTYKENERESLYFQEALITVSARTKSGG